MKRLPKSPEEKRATAAARQRRYMQRKVIRDSLESNIDYSAGVGPKPRAPLPPISSHDLATAYRDRIFAIVEEMDDSDILHKDFAAAIANGLKAQNTLDGREKLKAKTGQTLELVAGIRQIMLGLPAAPRLIEDGLTVDGEYEVVEDAE